MKCEHGTTPWWDCEEGCTRRPKYGFLLKGGGWTPKTHITVGDLPPSDEVDAQKREEGLR